MINKIRVGVLLAFTYFTLLTVQAQENSITIKYNVAADNSVDLSYDKPDPGTYTIKLHFDNLSNTYGAPDRKYTINGYSGLLGTLTPQNKNSGVGFSYKYSCIRGKLNPKFDPDFTYVLPCKKGSKVRVFESGFIGAMYFGSTTPEDWKVYQFCTPDEDTVTAIRKGIVVQVTDKYDTDAGEVSFRSTVNEITVEHADGTLATYRGFKKSSITVKVGQTIFPGTILGINSRYNSKEMFAVSILLTYLKSDDFEGNHNQNLKTIKSMYGFITPHFFTAENNAVVVTPDKDYTGANTPEIIKKEMTKRELKQWGK